MYLHAPSSWLTPGEGLQIRIVGEAAGSNTWCIVYQATDALAYLHNAARYESWYDLEGSTKGNRHGFILTAPEHMAGERVTYRMGSTDYTLTLVKSGNVARGEFSLTGDRDELSNTYFALFHKDRKLFDIPGLFTKESETDLRELTLLFKQVSTEEDGKWLLRTRIVYKPDLISGLKQLSKTSLKDGKIYLMNSSHQDIAWMDSPENCIIERDTMLLTPLFDQAGEYPEYRFDIEDVLMIREFVERHPTRKGEIGKLLHSGKITSGSTYIQPYEEMYSGESLVRQFYLGAKWLSKEFDGYKPDTYWNVDVPGRTLQMPQIAQKAGTKFMVISRHEKGLFKWYSPDGSYVTVYSPGHYSLSYPYLQRDFFSAAGHIAEQSLWWGKYNTIPGTTPVIPLFSDWDMSPAEDYRPLISRWHNLKQIEDQAGNQMNLQLPAIRISSTRSFMDDILKTAGDLPSIMGERPAVWLYIHGPSHQKALKASREGDILMTTAEKFQSINAMLNHSFEQYPQERLTRAWEAKIYPDHGWGGKNGDITDAYFREKFEFARSEANEMTNEALHAIGSRIKTKNSSGIPVVVFNSLSWERSDPVQCRIEFEPGWGRNIKVRNAQGEKIASQIEHAERYQDGSLKSAVIHFIADNVPSIGYRTFYFSPTNRLGKNAAEEFEGEYENDFFTITFSRGTIKQIHDKELNTDLLDHSNLQGGEVFTLKSEGHGAGEFADIQQPTMEGFDKVSTYKPIWKKLESGDVFDSFIMRQPIRNATVEQILILYHKIKRIDIQVALLDWEGVLYREYRMAMPLNMAEGKIAYEVPFGVVEVGKDEIQGAAGERYDTPCSDIHPRGIENWIAAYNRDFAVTLSSSVAVADYIDPTVEGNNLPVLQPILLASRKSCHWEGNEYLQQGDHHFHFSITSHRPDWRNGYRFGRQANEKLHVVFNPEMRSKADLPEELSFFSTGAKNVMISAIKKCDDDNSLILRLFEIEGRSISGSLTSYFDLDRAFETSLIEEVNEEVGIRTNQLPLEIGKHAIETFKLVPVRSEK
jgi:alpha-mannosidase